MLVQGRKMICFADSNQKRAGVATLISDKIDSKAKIIKDKEKCYSHKGAIPSGKHNTHMCLTAETQNA